MLACPACLHCAWESEKKRCLLIFNLCQVCSCSSMDPAQQYHLANYKDPAFLKDVLSAFSARHDLNEDASLSVSNVYTEDYSVAHILWPNRRNAFPHQHEDNLFNHICNFFVDEHQTQCHYVLDTITKQREDRRLHMAHVIWPQQCAIISMYFNLDGSLREIFVEIVWGEKFDQEYFISSFDNMRGISVTKILRSNLNGPYEEGRLLGTDEEKIHFFNSLRVITPPPSQGQPRMRCINCSKLIDTRSMFGT